MILRKLLLLTAALVLLSGCNIFSFIDSPSGNAQLLSKARSCLDQGDLACAREYYAELSGDYLDSKNSELAYAILYEEGFEIGDFVKFGTQANPAKVGVSITDIANQIGSAASETKRIAFYRALKYVDLIQDQSLRGLVRLTSATVLLAEILAESNGTDDTLVQTDLVTSGTLSACLATDTTFCAVQCARTAHISLGASIDLNTSPLPDESTLTGNPTWGMVDGLLKAMNYASDTELQLGGSFGSGAGGFVDNILLQPIDTTDALATNCYAFQLLINGVGTN